jgi:hypothetical protein
VIVRVATILLFASLMCGTIKVYAGQSEDRSVLLNHLFASPALNKENLKDELKEIIRDETNGFSANYEEIKIITLLTKPLLSSGQLWFLSSAEVLKVQSKPFVFYTKISNDTIVQLDSSGKREAISVRKYAALRAFTSAFIGLFSGDIEKIDRYYSVHKKKEAEVWRIGLKPKGSTIRGLVTGIIVSGTTRMPDTIEIFHSSGDLTRLKISHRRPIDAPEERKVIHDLGFDR